MMSLFALEVHMPGFIFMKLMDHTEPLLNGRLTWATTTTLTVKTKTMSEPINMRLRFMTRGDTASVASIARVIVQPNRTQGY